MKRYRVFWTREAILDLSEIVEHISHQNLQAARSVWKKLKLNASKLGTHPERGRALPELVEHGITSFRELVCPPYRLIYRSSARSVYVLAVLDSRRDLESLLFNKLVRGSIRK